MVSLGYSPMVRYEDKVIFVRRASSVPSTMIAWGSPVVALGLGSEPIDVGCLVNTDGELLMD